MRSAASFSLLSSIRRCAALTSSRRSTRDVICSTIPCSGSPIPDILKLIEQQTSQQFMVADFIPVPCCFPTCNSVTYAMIDGDNVTPLSRIVNVYDYLDYITNRVMPDFRSKSAKPSKVSGRPLPYPVRRSPRSSSNSPARPAESPATEHSESLPPIC